MKWILVASVAVVGLTGCSRSYSEMWSDTKAASKHIASAWRSITTGPAVGDGTQIASDDFAGSCEDDFIPLNDQDLYNQIVRQDPHVLKEITADTPIPQSKVVPGECGSTIPDIDGFHKPVGKREASTFKPIHFAFDNYSVSGKENQEIVAQIARYMKSHPDTYIFVEGHCDQRGTAAYNLSLGTRRSGSVRNSLIKEGVHPDHLLTVSYGKERLLTAREDETGYATNRRAQFKLYQGGQG